MALRMEAFLALVRHRAPDHLKGMPFKIYAEVIRLQEKDAFEWADIEPTIKMLGEICEDEDYNIDITKDRKKQKTEVIIDQTEDLKRDFLIDKISPWVENIRIKLFKSSEPPFDWDGAVKWIEAESEKHKKDTTIPKDLINRIKEVEKEIPKYYASIDRKRQSLPYAKKDDEWEQNVSISSPNLALLEKETQRMAQATGFPQSSLVIYVLAGKKPPLSRVSLTATTHCVTLSDSESILKSLRGETPEPESLIRNEAILTIKSKDFSFRELLKIYKKLRESLSVGKGYSFSKNVKEKYSLIYNFVKELKLLPNSSKKSEWRFWKSAHSEWNKRYPDYKYGTWQGLRKAHKRIISNLENNRQQ